MPARQRRTACRSVRGASNQVHSTMQPGHDSDHAGELFRPRANEMDPLHPLRKKGVATRT